MEEKIYVSVICNTYNHVDFIRDALNSFVMQKTKYRFEVIVHDDASTDGTDEIVREYAEKYPSIIVPILEKENQYFKLKKEGKGGISQLISFPKTRGKYICFCEGDDYWIDEYLIEKKVTFLENHPEYCAYLHRTKFFSYDKNIFTGFSNKSEVEYDYTFLDAINLRSHTTGWLIRKEIYLNLDNVPEKQKFLTMFGDQRMGLWTTLIGKVRYTPEEMSVWRYNVPGSWTRRNINTTSDNQIKYYKRRLKFYKQLKKVTDKKYHQVINTKRLHYLFYLSGARKHHINHFILRVINKFYTMWTKKHNRLES